MSTNEKKPARRGSTNAAEDDFLQREGSTLSVRWGSNLAFLGAFVREPLTIGAIWPSSNALARKVAESCDIKPEDTVVELGPGTGAFTKLILERLNPQGRFLGVEITQANVDMLRKRFPRSKFVCDSAEHLSKHLKKPAQCVVSGLAWGNMRPALQDRIMKAVCDNLAPGGQFVAFAYAHAFLLPTTQRFRRQMFKNFARVEMTRVIWANIPPAYIYRCWRSKG